MFLKIESIKKLIFKISNSLFSFECYACENSVHKQGLCIECLGEIEANKSWIKIGEYSIFSFWEYSGPMRGVIHRFKYHGFIKTIKSMLLEVDCELNFKKTLFIPIPLSLSRKRERGFNQAQVIAEVLAKKYSAKYKECLKRSRFKQSQTKLSSSQRINNLKGRFKLEKRYSPHEIAELNAFSIYIVDDVYTTGSTILSAIGVLEGAGIKVKGAIVLARAPLQRENSKDQASLAIFGPDYGFLTRNYNGQDSPSR